MIGSVSNDNYCPHRHRRDEHLNKVLIKTNCRESLTLLVDQMTSGYFWVKHLILVDVKKEKKRGKIILSYV